MSTTLPRLPERVFALNSFYQAGILGEDDLFATAALLQAVGAPDLSESVLLGLALAVRAPSTGHICVELARAAVMTSTPGGEETVGTLPWPDLQTWQSELLACEAMVSSADRAEEIPRRPLVLDRGRLYLMRAWMTEREVAAELLRLAGPVDSLAGPELRHAAGASEDQVEAIRVMLTGRLTVLTGGPGTGKTTTVARVLMELLTAPHGDDARPLQVALAAPTGKAAARLQEVLLAALASQGASEELRQRIDAARPTTLHKLLGARPEHFEGSWTYHRMNRLPFDLVIVDEASMVSLAMMGRLVQALRGHARLILVGDPDQLASVDAGTVLADIVRPGTHGTRGVFAARVAHLTRVHRFGSGSGIVALAAAVRDGRREAFFSELEQANEAIRWIDPVSATGRDEVRELQERLAAHAQAVVQRAASGDASGALAEMLRVRTLAANRLTEWGVAGWNWQIERRLDKEVNETWYSGRPILITRNDAILRLMNGDIGVVALVDGRRRVVFGGPNATLQVVPTARLGSFETVHAMTIHKSQGSEFDHVVLVLPLGRSPLLTRELLYTGITRSRTQLTIVGSRLAIETAIATPVVRASGLGDRLHP